MIKTITATFLFVFVPVFPVVGSADWDAGVDAYKAGDYATAFKQWKPLAEQGHAKAQSNFGWLYESGSGVPQNYKEAVKWYRKAAEQGDADAQFHLTRMYEDGKGVPQNYVECYVWSSIAAAADFYIPTIAESTRNRCAEELDTESLNQAQAKAAEHWEKYGSE